MITSIASSLRFDIPPIEPDYSRFPFQQTLQEWAGSIQGTVLIVCGILFIVGVATWVAGRMGLASQTMQRVGVGALIVGVLGAVLIGSVWTFMNWGINQEVL